MKLTVLDIVQRTLESINEDSVNSISDTDQSEQVAYIVRDVYLGLMASKTSWPHLEQAVTFTGLGNTSRPTHMELDDDVEMFNIYSVFYDKRALVADPPLYREVQYLDPTKFLTLSASRSSDSDNTTTLEVSDFSGIKVYVRTDAAPMCYTSFDDHYIVFDGYDSDVDSSLQGSKVQAIGKKTPDFTVSDLFIPDLPERWFQYLLAEVKSVASVEINQQANPKAEQQSRNIRSAASRTGRKAYGTPFDRRPDYGRH